MENKIKVYRNVFSREDVLDFSFNDLIKNPEVIYNAFKLEGFEEELLRIKSIVSKGLRNEAKRSFMPAADLSESGIFSIDIDNISDRPKVKDNCIAVLSGRSDVLCVMETASGNLVVFFKYNCSVEDYPFLYYRAYLQLTLELSVNIDFLPEVGRLRYVSNGEVYHYNEDSDILDEILEVESLPYINTQVSKDTAREQIFGSR